MVYALGESSSRRRSRDSRVRFVTHFTRVRFNVLTLVCFTCVFLRIQFIQCAVLPRRIRYSLTTRSTRISCAIFSKTNYHHVSETRQSVLRKVKATRIKKKKKKKLPLQS